MKFWSVIEMAKVVTDQLNKQTENIIHLQLHEDIYEFLSCEAELRGVELNDLINLFLSEKVESLIEYYIQQEFACDWEDE